MLYPLSYEGGDPARWYALAMQALRAGIRRGTPWSAEGVAFIP